MHNYRKKIGHMIRMNGLFNGLIAGVITAGLLAGILYWLKYALKWQYLIVLPVCILVWLIFFMILAMSNVHAIKKRIASLDRTTGIELDQEQFEHITKELMIGRQWLVYRKKLDFRFWTKPIVEDIDVHPKTFGNRTVVTIRTRGEAEPEVLKVTSQDQLGYKLQTWFYRHDEVQ